MELLYVKENAFPALVFTQRFGLLRFVIELKGIPVFHVLFCVFQATMESAETRQVMWISSK